MSKDIRIKRGLNIKLKGAADKILATFDPPGIFAITPEDFKGINPKLVVKEGDEVLAGQPIMFDKNMERVKFCSPVSGEVTEIVRGPKRKLLEIRILQDKELKYVSFPSHSPSDLSRDKIVETLLESGLWPFLRQRPYGVIANPKDTPKSIHISCFDSNPLGPDVDFTLHGLEQDFNIGLEALKRLTSGKIHLNVDGSTNPNKAFTEAKGVQINRFRGPHPAGNIGVQIHHIEPINKGEVIWYLYPQDVVCLGRLFSTGKADFTKIIALTGSELLKPRYVRTLPGAQVKPLLADNVKEGKVRIISGNILSGRKIEKDGFLGFYDTQITTILEGDQPEFFGWLIPDPNKFSNSRTLFSWLQPNKEYVLDTNMHGEERAFVVTEEYEKVFPFDIYPVHLIKSVMINDIDSMEKLGIYEVAPEDFALCEFVCTSKINSQEIVRQGLDVIHKECM